MLIEHYSQSLSSEVLDRHHAQKSTATFSADRWPVLTFTKVSESPAAPSRAEAPWKASIHTITKAEMDPPPDLSLSSRFHARCEGSRPHLWPRLTHLRPHAGNRRMPGSSVRPGAAQRPGPPATTQLIVGIPPQLTSWPLPRPFVSPWAGRGNGPFLGWLFFCSATHRVPSRKLELVSLIKSRSVCLSLSLAHKP